MNGEEVSDPATVEAGWAVRHDEVSGQVYYWNTITGETSWEPPPHFANSENVVHPWTQAFDNEGRVYYLNTETMETRWTPPPDSSEHDVLEVSGGRGRRPSTAEQMHELNQLLSGGDGDGEDESPEVEEVTIVSASIKQEKSTADGEECPWMMFINEDDGVPYYYNHTTNECLWEPPEEFLRFQQRKQLENVDEATLAATKADNSVVSERLDHADAKDKGRDSTTSNELSDNAAMQVVVTPEFEEKVRQAIAAVSNTPVGSSRLVLVRTPTQQQLAPRTGRSAGGISARSHSNSARSQRDPISARSRSGSSRPSSGGVVSRPRMLSIPTTIEGSSAVEEEITVNASEDGFQSENEVAPVDDLGVPNEQDDERQIPLSIPTKSVEEREIENAGSADNKEDDNIAVVTSEVKVEEKTGAIETALVPTVKAPVENKRDNHEETNNAGVHESTDKINAETEEIIENATATRKVENLPLDTVLVEQNIQAAALTLQCMLRCFIAQQRVKHKREERQNANQPTVESFSVGDAIDTTATAPSPMIAEDDNEDTNTLTSPPAQEAERDEEPYLNDPDSIPQPDAPSNNGSPATVPFDVDQDLPLISVQNDVRNDDNESADTPPSPRQTVPSGQSSAVTSTRKQHPRRDPATISTRLPSVLDVAKYFPHRRSATSSRIAQSGSSTNSNEHVAITRKKVDTASPRVRRAVQQQRIEHEQLMEKRRKEDDRAQRAQVVEYQRIYAESRKKYEAEKQRLLAEKVVRDNQRAHDAEVEKRARIQAQRERDAARWRYKTVDDKADRVVWEHMKAQGQPTEQCVSRFRDALTQALDSAQFPDKMCEERARELNERIKRLHRASWAVDSQLEDVELRLISELHPLTARQRPFQAKYAAKLRWHLEQILNMVQSWQRVIDERESGKENGSTNKYWGSIQARYSPSSTISLNAESRCQYVLNEWRGAAGGDSLLHVAAWNGWEEHVRLLIEEGSDVNLVDCSASHRTPLHEACRAGHASVVEQLLRSGARLNAVDISGDSSLHIACRGGWTRVVRILLMAANDLGEERDPSAVDNQPPLTLEDFFNLRNGKGKRAMEVTTLPSLMEELLNYDYQLNGEI